MGREWRVGGGRSGEEGSKSRESMGEERGSHLRQHLQPQRRQRRRRRGRRGRRGVGQARGWLHSRYCSEPLSQRKQGPAWGRGREEGKQTVVSSGRRKRNGAEGVKRGAEEEVSRAGRDEGVSKEEMAAT